MTSGGGWRGQFFCNGLGLSLGAQLVSTNDRPSIFSKIFGLFASGGEEKCAAFCTIRLDVLQGMPVEISAQKIEDLTCLCSVFNIKQNLAKKLDPTLKPSNLKEITCLTHFYAKKPKRPLWFL